MRVGIVSRVLAPSGNLRWSLGLGRALSDLGHDVTLLFFRDSPAREALDTQRNRLKVEVSERGARAHFSRLAGTPVLKMKYFENGFPPDAAPEPISWMLLPLLASWQNRFDLLLCYDQYVAVAGLALERFHGIPYVVFTHETPAPREPAILRMFLQPWQAAVFGGARLRCAPTKRIADGAMQIFGVDFSVIEYGCSPVDAMMDRKDNYVLVDTRWTIARDPFFLLEVAKRLSDVDFILAGLFVSHDLFSRFQSEMLRLDLARRINIRLHPTEAEYSYLYKHALAYLRWTARATDGFVETGPSLGVYRALEAGCPLVVTTDLSGAEELHARSVAIRAERNPASVADAIEVLRTDQSLSQEMANRSWALSKEWSWSNRAMQLLSRLSDKG